MKKIYLFCMLLAAVLFFTACSEDRLDIQQKGVTGTEKYLSANDGELLDMIGAVYSKVHGDAFQSFMFHTTACAMSIKYDLSRMGGECGEYYRYDETSTAKTYSQIWSYYYTLCYWSNMIISNVPGNNVASEAVKNQVIAEARAIRSISMMYLVQLYGNPPLADHIMQGNEANTPAADSWAFIEKELQEAAEQLPSKNGIDGQAAIGGRITREACYAYLGKALLWEGKYDEAAQTLYNKVIATGKYALVPDFVTLNSSSNDFSSENIWEFDFNDDPANSLSQEGNFDLIVYGIAPADVNLPAMFRQDQSYGRGGSLSKEVGEFLQSHEKTAAGGHSRRYYGTCASYDDLMNDSYYTYTGTKGLKRMAENNQGYWKIKDEPLAADVVGSATAPQYQFTKRNLVYMRYAEVLLNYAEAVAMGGTPGAMSGLEALNIVRRRAGLADAPTLSMDDPLYGVKAEREAELVNENCRLIDLIRWGDADKVLADCGKYKIDFNGYKEGSKEYDLISTRTVGEGFKKGKNELFPIPSSERNNNKNLMQNPGW